MKAQHRSVKARGRLAAVAVLGALALVTSACSSSGGSAGSTGPSPSAEPLSVGIVEYQGSDVTVTAIANGFEDKAKSLGYDVTRIDSQASPDKAIAAIQNFVTKKVDLIVTIVYPAETIQSGLIQAKAAGIPTMSLAGSAGNGVQYLSDAGYEPGLLMANHIAADTGGKGDLLFFGFAPGAPCRAREEALDKVRETADFSSYTREEASATATIEDAAAKTTAWLTKHPDTGQSMAVLGCWDGPALGAITAIKQAGRTGVKVYGFNAEVAAQEALKSGDMTATVYLDSYGGGADAAEAAATVVAAGVDATPTVVSAPAQIVTKESLDAFLQEFPEAAKGQG